MARCENCGAATSRRCAKCSVATAYYCSDECQRNKWPLHIFQCNRTKPIPSAYYLYRFILLREPHLRDPQTRRDYGFDEVSDDRIDTVMLMAVYVHLIEDLGTTPKTLNLWCIQGKLAEEGIKALEKLPAHQREPHCTWLKKNRIVVEGGALKEEMGEENAKAMEVFFAGIDASAPWYGPLARGVSYARDGNLDADLVQFSGLHESTIGWATGKVTCAIFCGRVLLNSTPIYGEVEGYAWVDFGFGTCNNEEEECRLLLLYSVLLKHSTFDEFYKAYESHSLVDLLRAKHLWKHCQEFRHIEDIFLSTPASIKPVWQLRWAATTNDLSKLYPDVSEAYGFNNCADESEKSSLLELYREYFRLRGDPIRLHEAAGSGSLFDTVISVVRIRGRGRKRFFRGLMA